jgi:hypothetical protein
VIEEQRIRKYALQCCLCVIRGGKAIALFERVPGTRRVKVWLGPIASQTAGRAVQRSRARGQNERRSGRRAAA